MVYPAKKGRGKLRLTITTALSDFGADVDPEAPGEDEVVSYEEYLRGFFPDDAPPIVRDGVWYRTRLRHARLVSGGRMSCRGTGGIA